VTTIREREPETERIDRAVQVARVAFRRKQHLMGEKPVYFLVRQRP
jgi:hypothetical protein